jgi:hypothetical protein
MAIDGRDAAEPLQGSIVASDRALADVASEPGVDHVCERGGREHLVLAAVDGAPAGTLQVVAHRTLRNPELARDHPGRAYWRTEGSSRLPRGEGSASDDRDRLQEHRPNRSCHAYAGGSARDFASPKRTDTASPDNLIVPAWLGEA